MEVNEVVVFTDGSCYPNPNGPGGWSFVARHAGVVIERYGHLPSTTNNEAELTAIYRALLFVKESLHHLSITTDSQYAYRSLTVWRYQWEKVGWKNSIGKPVSNKELILQIVELVEWHRTFRTVNFHWVKGHAGNPLNELADVLAGRARTEKITSEKGCELP